MPALFLPQLALTEAWRHLLAPTTKSCHHSPRGTCRCEVLDPVPGHTSQQLSLAQCWLSPPGASEDSELVTQLQPASQHLPLADPLHHKNWKGMLILYVCAFMVCNNHCGRGSFPIKCLGKDLWDYFHICYCVNSEKHVTLLNFLIPSLRSCMQDCFKFQNQWSKPISL